MKYDFNKPELPIPDELISDEGPFFHFVDPKDHPAKPGDADFDWNDSTIEHTMFFEENDLLAELLSDGVLFSNVRAYDANDIGKPHEPDLRERTIVLFMNCNDVFSWGCADAECITIDEIPDLYLLWRDNHKWGPMKWACKKRNLQPQRPIVIDMKKDGYWDATMADLPGNKE